jgi:hypothetical protein
MKIVGECKLCGDRKPLVKAHIIPKQFYRRIRGASPHLIVAGIDSTDGKSFSQNGIHDTGILCAECDNRLGIFDQYGYQVLHEHPIESQIERLGPQLAVYRLGKIDVERFRLFLVALVWRASISTSEVFQLVTLGPYEERLRAILAGEPSSAITLKTVTAALVLFRPPKYEQILWSPFRSTFCGVNVITFYIYPWKLLLKLDRRPFEKPLDKLALDSQREAVAFVQDWWSPGEFAVLQDLQTKLRRCKAA